MPFANALPAALSPSRLQDFQSCPRRFQHGSIDRIPQPATYATVKGNLAHYVFEQLFKLPPEQRTHVAATKFIPDAEIKVLTDTVRNELQLSDVELTKRRDEVAAIVATYFQMEDPTTVSCEGVELRITDTIEGVPMLGILDRLDRCDDGSLMIVDYKTGSLPNRNYDTQTFANAEIYAALCETNLGERPRVIRLMYVAKGKSIDREVTAPVVLARRRSAASAWQRIEKYYADGEFPAQPSVNSCRFCSYKDLCRSNGVAVP